MLTPGMLPRDGTGRLRCTTDPASTVSTGGTPVAASTGLLGLALSNPAAYVHGAGYAATGALSADIGGTVAFQSQGLPFTSAGRVACHQSDAITGYYGGLPITAAGALATAAPE